MLKCSFDCDQVMKLQNLDYYSKYSNVTHIPPYLCRLQKSHPFPWTVMGPYFRENMYGTEQRKTNHVLILSNCFLNHTCDANLKNEQNKINLRKVQFVIKLLKCKTVKTGITGKQVKTAVVNMASFYFHFRFFNTFSLLKRWTCWYW